ncbi:MAG: hypothetical protein Q7R63_00365 [bacterium]|nr:hypothetical protein [bacterium]
MKLMILYCGIASSIIFSPLLVFAAPPSLPCNTAPSADEIRKAQRYIWTLVRDQAERAELERLRNSLLIGGNKPGSVITPASRVFSRAIAKYSERIAYYTKKLAKSKAASAALGKIVCIAPIISAHDDLMTRNNPQYCREKIQAAIDGITEEINETDTDIKNIQEDIKNAQTAYNAALAAVGALCEPRNRNFSIEQCNDAISKVRALEGELQQLKLLLEESKTIKKKLEKIRNSLENDKIGVI